MLNPQPLNIAFVNLEPYPMPPSQTIAETADATFRVVADPTAIEHEWRTLAAEGGATPYQRFEWSRAWFASAPAIQAKRPAIVLASDEQGLPIAILPLEIERHGPVRIATFAGGKNSNAQMGLFSKSLAERLDPTHAQAFMQAVAKALGRVDLFALTNQPIGEGGQPNPLANLPSSRPAPSPAFSVDLGPDPDMIVNALLSGESRKKLRKKMQWLNAIGTAQVRQASSEAEVSQVLDAFFRQKRQRLTALGIANPFDLPRTQNFLRRAALDGLAEGRPAIEIHALWCGDRVAAAFGGCNDGRRLSGVLISFEPDPTLMRSSPGELLTRELVRSSCLRGLAKFDLGIGEEPYKLQYCPVVEARVDTFLPMTALGSVAASALGATAWAKTRIKKDRRLLDVARRTMKQLKG